MPSESTKNSPKSAEIDGFEPARQAILPKSLKMAAFDGWSDMMLQAAAREAEVDAATLKAAFPGGVADLIRYWSENADVEMREAMGGPAFDSLKIREKVAFAVRKRLSVLRPHKEAARRAAAFLALPMNAALAGKLAWSTADAIWRDLGDKSTDFNFYSKRGILVGVWLSTFSRWLADDSEEEEATAAFLDARIDNVMQIEKAKGKLRETGLDPAKPIEWLARLRYPAG